VGRQPNTPKGRARFSEAMKDDAKFPNVEKRREEFEANVKDKEARKRRRRGKGQQAPASAHQTRGDMEVSGTDAAGVDFIQSGTVPVVTEPMKRDREAASSSAAAAVSEEDKWCELATKLRRKENGKNKDGDDDMKIQDTLADIDEEGDNDLLVAKGAL
jgi:hypothetical protein